MRNCPPRDGASLPWGVFLVFCVFACAMAVFGAVVVGFFRGDARAFAVPFFVAAVTSGCVALCVGVAAVALMHCECTRECPCIRRYEATDEKLAASA